MGSIGVKILGGAALLLVAVMGLGVAMPSTWEAEASGTIEAPASAVMAYLDSPEGWQAWTPWPDSVFLLDGPEHGPGSGIAWDDPEFGQGSFVLREVTPNGVAYDVQVNDGAMTTAGTIELVAEAGATRMTWREEGDLGWNPLMGFWALSMDRAQAEELEKGVVRLAELVAGGAPDSDAGGGAEDSVPPIGND